MSMRSLGTFVLIVATGLSCQPSRPESRQQSRISPGDDPDGGVIVSTSQVVRPAGIVVEYPGRPVDLALSPDGKTVYVKDRIQLTVIDATSWKVRQHLP